MPDTPRPGRPRTRTPAGPAAQIGEQIRTRRLACGLSQEQLGAAVGVDARTIGAYERGEYNLSLEMAGRLATALECSLDELACTKRIRK